MTNRTSHLEVLVSVVPAIAIHMGNLERFRVRVHIAAINMASIRLAAQPSNLQQLLSHRLSEVASINELTLYRKFPLAVIAAKQTRTLAWSIAECRTTIFTNRFHTVLQILIG